MTRARAEELAHQQHANIVLNNQLLHDQAIRVDELNEQLTVRAIEKSVDVPTLNLIRLDEERQKLEIDKHQQLTDIDLDKRRHEVELDVKAALTVALVDKHKVLHVQDQVLLLLERAHEVKTSTKPQELKDAQLEILNEVIIGLRGQLRGYLQGDSQKDLPAGDTGSES